jgi:hypothetical protein
VISVRSVNPAIDASTTTSEVIRKNFRTSLIMSHLQIRIGQVTVLYQLT